MKSRELMRIEWTGSDLGELVWKFPFDNIVWGSELVIKENQAAAIFTGSKPFIKRLMMHDYFGKVGNYVLLPDSLPLLSTALDSSQQSRAVDAIVVFCSIKEQSYSDRIYTGDSYGQAYVGAEADADCKLRVQDAKLFFEKVVAPKKRTNDTKVVDYLHKTLGDELFRRQPPYGWPAKQKTALAEVWQDVGIGLIALKFDNYAQYGGGASA